MEDTDVVEITKEDIKITEPSRYKVIFHNDNVSTYQYVVYVLMEIYNKTIEEAKEITITVDKTGKGIAGIYSKEIAEHKVAQTDKMSADYGYPLQVSVEKE